MSNTAVHEAGHTVISLYCNLPVERVKVVRETGSCLIRLPKSTPPILYAAVLIAGFLAAKIDDHYTLSGSSNSDFTEAAELLTIAGANLNDFIPKVRNRLVSLWPSVERIARVLDYHGKIEGVELIRAVAGLPYLLK